MSNGPCNRTEPRRKGAGSKRLYGRRESEDRIVCSRERTRKGNSIFLDRKLPETTVRRLKSEYLLAMKAVVEESKEEGTVPQVSILPKMAQGRPLLLGKELDKSVQDYINAMRKVGGVVNTAMMMAAANGIIAARSPALLYRQIKIRQFRLSTIFAQTAKYHSRQYFRLCGIIPY